jgi:DNA invertase Pin-like site-specific DNA recombinase
VAERMRALGWKHVEIVDGDLGCSAAMASARREGFERVLSSVALGEVGIVGSREVSRLSRTDKDWCRLLEVPDFWDSDCRRATGLRLKLSR